MCIELRPLNEEAMPSATALAANLLRGALPSVPRVLLMNIEASQHIVLEIVSGWRRVAVVAVG